MHVKVKKNLASFPAKWIILNLEAFNMWQAWVDIKCIMRSLNGSKVTKFGHDFGGSVEI